MTKKKNRQRLGSAGGGLTLPAFANAKSRPRFNPADIRKRREQFENAKEIKKYKTLSKHFHTQKSAGIEEIAGASQRQGKIHPASKSLSSSRGSSCRHTTWSSKKRKNGSQKGKNALEALRQEYLERKETEDRSRAERLEALKTKEEARSKALQKRKDLKAKMLKKTSSGQPLMKHRLQHILDSIQDHS